MQAVQLSYELGVPLDQLPAATPFDTGSDLLRLLRLTAGLEQFSDSQPRDVAWRLDVLNGNSASLRSFSEPDVATRAALSLVRGFKQAEGSAQLPNAWSLPAGRAAEKVATRLGDTTDTGLDLRVVGTHNEEARAHVTRIAARHLRSATDLRISSYGSVVGILGRVTARGRRRTAALWSDLNGRRVEVQFGEQHVEDMRTAWAHAHVEVTGVLHENVAGQVLRVNMDSLQVLDTVRVSLSDALPRGFYPEMTNGLGALEYLRTVRGETR